MAKEARPPRRPPDDKGCDVQIVVNDQAQGGDALDVRLEPKAQDKIDTWEEDEELTFDLSLWSEKLRQLAPEAYADRPKPRKRALAQPGTDAKISIMRERVERGEDLFGDKDLRTDSIDQAGREIRRCRNGRDERGQLRELGDEPPKGGAA